MRTLAGNGLPGHKDGSGTSSQFFYPVGIAVDADGTAFVADRANHRVRKVTSKGTVSTLAGSGRNAVVDGKGQMAAFAWPNAITLDKSEKGGAIYVSDTFHFRIRKDHTRRADEDGMYRSGAAAKAARTGAGSSAGGVAGGGHGGRAGRCDRRGGGTGGGGDGGGTSDGGRREAGGGREGGDDGWGGGRGKEGGA